MFDKVRDFVEKSFNDKEQMLHFDRTVYWIQQLRPDADEALLVAAISHDIERAFQGRKDGFGSTNKNFLDKDELTHHQEKGAVIIGKFLEENGGNEEIIGRVKHLVARHEFGGDNDQNLLKDADSLSFVENNGPMFLKRFDKLGYERIKEKFDWMYDRITDPQAKDIAKPFYEKMIQELNTKAQRK